jgi:hypothetical protein
MAVNKNVQEQEVGKVPATNRQPVTSSVSRSTYKAPGTRFGTLLDWRAASPKTGETAGRYGRVLRDGQ